MSPRGRRPDESLDRSICDAALALFADGGLAAVSFERVAERAGTSRTAIYRRHRTRDDLVLAAISRLRAAGERGSEDWASWPLERIVTDWIEQSARALADPGSLQLLAHLAGSGADGTALRRAYWDAIVQPRREAFSAVIVAAGRAPDTTTAELLQDQLTGALLHRALLDPDPLDEVSARDYLTALARSVCLL